MSLNVATAFFLALVPITASSSFAKSQSDIETFEFIAFGDFEHECGKGGLSEVKNCKIESSDDNITKSFTIKDNRNVTVNLSKIDECKYRFSVSADDFNADRNFDFSRFSPIEYDRARSVTVNNDAHSGDGKALFRGYSNVSGFLNGVNIDGSLRDENISSEYYRVNVFISSRDVDSAVKRYESALSYFKENFCSGSAF